MHRDSRPFKDLADWIESFLESTEALSSQWKEMFLDQQDFWINFPNLVFMLSNRRYVQT